GRLASLGSQPEAAESVRRALQGGRADWRSRAWEAFLVASLLIAFFFLLWLMLSILVESLPVWQDRGVVSFLTTPLASNPDQAGISQGLFGSVIMMFMVSLVALPAGIAAAIYLEEYAPDN